MLRTVKKIEKVSYAFTRLEILEAMRDVLQETHPGAALVIDKRNMHQHCEFLSMSGAIQNVEKLVITTTYEEPESGPCGTESTE